MLPEPTPASDASASDAAGRDQRWDAVLTELETALAAADADGVAPTSWTEPTGLGPMPRAMVGRASRLAAAQRDAIARVDARRAAIGEHLGAVRAVDATREPHRSVYLDVTG